VIPPILRQKSTWLALVLAALLLGPGAGWGATMTVSQQNQSLYPEPNFAAAPIIPVPVGAQVNVLQQTGEWYQVEYQGKTGWLHRLAFPQAQAPSKLGLPSMLFGGPVRETKSDEVALAGKGFTPEVESGFRQKHPEMNYALVDKVEAFRVDDATLRTFIQEGGLKP
jgi:hypothetical protein